jgi:HEAT repeat protein
MNDAELLNSACRQLSDGAEETRYAAVRDLARVRSLDAVPLLMSAVGDSSYRIREKALEGICSFPREVIFPRLEDFLRNHENANLRTAAIEAFPRYGHEATPFLLGLLTDSDEEVRMFVATILGDVRDPQAVEDLIDALRDQDENVRHAAAESLGKIRDARAVGPLLDCLHQDFWLQYPAVIALGNIGDTSATIRLIEFLDDEMLRQAVIEALGKIADVSAIPVLTNILSHRDPSVRNDAIAALVSIQRQIKPDGTCLPSIKKALDRDELIGHLLASLQDPDLEVKKNAIIALGWLREQKAVPGLVPMLLDYDLEEYVVGSLVAIGEDALPGLISGLAIPDPKIRASLIRCLDWIGHLDGIKACLPFLASENKEVRYSAIMAMAGALENEEIENALLRLLLDPDPEIQALLVEIMAKSRSERLIAKLLPELASPSPQQRYWAIQIISRLKNPAAYEALQPRLEDTSDKVRAEAYKALALIKTGPLSVEILRQGLRDQSPTVRQAVARCVRDGSDAIVNHRLTDLLQDPDPEVRLAAIEALGRIGDAALVEALVASFAGGNKQQRLATIRALGNIPAKSCAHFLVDLLKEPDPDLKRTALESLGTIKDKRSVPNLIVALDDSDWGVRSAAISALAAIGDQRCSARLLEKLEDPEDIIKKEAILALGQLRYVSAVNSILPLVHNEGLQAEVISSLGKLGIPDFDQFSEFFKRSNTRLKCLLVDLLGRLRDPRAVDFLARVFEDEFFTVRCRAAKALGELGDLKAISALLKAQKEDPSEEVQKEAILALKKLDAKK